MQAIVWIIRLLIVLLLVWFASKNADPVKIHGVLDQAWEAPLVFVLLVAFVAGLRKSTAQLAARPAPPVAPGTEPPVVDLPDRSARGEAHGL